MFNTTDSCAQKINFRVQGNTPGATWTLFRKPQEGGQFTQRASGTVIYGQTQMVNEDVPQESAYQYQLRVSVGGRVVNTQPITEIWTGCILT
jgi:hypothetical protein